MRVAVDQEHCLGSGQCTLTAPTVFDQRDEDGVVVLLDAEPPAEVHARVEQAAVNCPARAITIERG